jgi:hypothetical protein
MENTKTNISTQIVSNPHRGGLPCVAIFGVDTHEAVDSYTADEMNELINIMEKAIADLRAAQILDANLPTLFD